MMDMERRQRTSASVAVNGKYRESSCGRGSYSSRIASLRAPRAANRAERMLSASCNHACTSAGPGAGSPCDVADAVVAVAKAALATSAVANVSASGVVSRSC